MLRVDLKAAKIPENTEEGVVDFHALRVTYITNLARSGIRPKNRPDTRKAQRYSVDDESVHEAG
jgi:hypothetical protein